MKGWAFGVKVSHGVTFVVLGKRAFKRWRRRRRRWRWVKKRLPKKFEGITEV